MTRVLQASFAVFVLAVAACSSGDGGGSPVDSLTTSASTTTTTSETGKAGPETEADQQLADSMGLKLSDFPSGWREQAATDLPGLGDLGNDVPECEEYAALRTGSEATAAVESPDFRTESESVTATVQVFATAEEAEAQLEVEVVACAQAGVPVVLERRVEADPDLEDLSLGEITGGPLSISPQGDQIVAYQFVIPLESEGFELDQFTDFVLVRVGRALALFTFDSQFSAFFEDDRDSIVGGVVARMEANRAELE